MENVTMLPTADERHTLIRRIMTAGSTSDAEGGRIELDKAATRARQRTATRCAAARLQNVVAARPFENVGMVAGMSEYLYL